MTKFTASLAVLASLLALGLDVAPAQALNTRSFISALGNDANACTRAAPCRTLQVAHDKTLAGGEINFLDPGGYGTLVITKAISIVNDGVGSAGILVPSGGTGITINAAGGGYINIRGLIIEGGGVGKNGIEYIIGPSVSIENCVIRNVTDVGIYHVPIIGFTNLYVSNSYIADNALGIGIFPGGNADVTNASITGVELHNNGFGIFVSGQGAGTNNLAKLNVSVTDSIAAQGSGNGVGVFVTTSAVHAVTNLTLTRFTSVNNLIGLQVSGVGATLTLARSTVTRNTTHGWNIFSGGILQSYGDNSINSNGANVGALTSIAAQ
jgi:hypothetical protein